MLRAVSEAAVFQLSALPPLLFSRGQLGFTESTEEERTKFAPAAQRLVRRHPGSGRLPLYLSSHIGRVRGWQGPEALTLIRGLTEHATQREFV
jgi:alpha-ketoglutarate-dependent 2,4-dichlorophenoxyacetate dioxygenase